MSLKCQTRYFVRFRQPKTNSIKIVNTVNITLLYVSEVDAIGVEPT